MWMNNGYILNDRYKILSQIGEGGMADVYLAQDLILHRKVAVKFLRLDFRDDPKAKARFQHEAMAASGLNNPHIVGIFDVDEVEGMQYIVMEWVDGEDLKHYIADNYPIPLGQAVDIMEQICSAVSEAHRNNIIHRDLKPQNILIDKNRYVKITDFGISKAETEDTMTQTRSIIGSIHYLSPEQIKGRAATKQSDIYSLGIILFEILTGKVPFNGDSAVSIALKHSQEPMPSVRKINPQIPQALENVVLKATAKVPSDRYLNVDEMAADLNTSLELSRSDEAKFIPDSKKTVKNDVDGETRVLPFNSLPNDDSFINNAQADEKQNQPESKQSNNSKKPNRKRRRRILLTSLIGVLLLIFIFIFVSAMGKTQVPVVSGLVENAAEQKIESADLMVGKITYKSSSNINKGRVIYAVPKENSTVKKNSKVDLVISSGLREVRVDNYVGEDYSQVAKKLEAKGFKVKRRNAPSDNFKPGKIIQQDFPVGAKYVPGKTTLVFVVSTGIKEVTLKDLTGMTKDQVISYTNKYELNPTFEYVYSDGQPNGRVVRQSPRAGQTIRQGSNIAIWISRGSQNNSKATPLNSFNIKITIPFLDASSSSSQSNSNGNSGNSGSNSENIVLIYLKDHDHSLSNVYKQMVIKSDTTVYLPFKLAKNEVGKYRVVRDGKTILQGNNITAQSH